MRVFLEATSEANETVSGANSLYGQSSKEAMNGCRRDLEMVKKRFEIGRDGTGMCDDEDVDMMGKGGGAGGAGRMKRGKVTGGFFVHKWCDTVWQTCTALQPFER